MSPPVENRLSIAYSSTNGVVEALEVNIQRGVTTKRLFSLHVEVENPITKVTSSCAANSIAVLTNHLAVAGDDGSLRLADFHGAWTTKVTRHFAAVVKVVSLPNFNGLLTLGADHRLLLWQLTEAAEVSLKSEVMLTGLGDPQNISLIPLDEVKRDYLAMACGSGLQLCLFTL